MLKMLPLHGATKARGYHQRFSSGRRGRCRRRRTRRARRAGEQLPAVARVGGVDLGREHARAAGTTAQAAALDDDVAVGHRRAGRVPARVVHRRLVLQALVGRVAGDADGGVVGAVAAQAVVTADGHRRAGVRVLHLHGAEQVGVGVVGDQAGRCSSPACAAAAGSQTSISIWPPWVIELVAGPVVRRGVGAPAADAAERLHLALGGQRHVDRHQRPRCDAAPRAARPCPAASSRPASRPGGVRQAAASSGSA